MSRWKLSAGTACAIGKKKIKTDVLPTTAYIMLGEKCQNNCRFCAQSRESEARENMLSRVTWPAFSGEEAADSIGNAYAASTIKRACLQVVQSAESWGSTIDALKVIGDRSVIPICVSSHIDTVAQARELVARGAERVCIALDAATPELYQKVKGGHWASRWRLLMECGEALPNRITTHLIVGLGESEEDMVGTMADCIKQGITIGLFAFTPVRGTEWADHMPPPISQYRRIQIAHHLLKHGYKQEKILYQNGQISGFEIPIEELLTVLADGKAFQTSGCDDCNRPYYNERPGGVMYNYPRSLTSLEVSKAIYECEVVRRENDELANY